MNVAEQKINRKNYGQIIQQLKKLASSLKAAKTLNTLSKMEHLANAEADVQRMVAIAKQDNPLEKSEEFNEKLLGLIKELNKVDDKNFEAVKRYLKRKIDRAKQKQQSRQIAHQSSGKSSRSTDAKGHGTAFGPSESSSQGPGQGQGKGKGPYGQGEGEAENGAADRQPDQDAEDDQGSGRQGKGKEGTGGRGRSIPPNTVLDISPEALDLILKRIRAAMSLEVQKCLAHDRDVKVPAQYENNVEKYYQNLSDDID